MNLIVACICNIAAWGIPASREPIIHILDNGEVDTIFLYGDEYSSYRVNKHNQRLLNSRLFLEENPQINHNRTTIHAPQRLLLQSYMPSRGKVHVPVLLVDLLIIVSPLKIQLHNLTIYSMVKAAAILMQQVRFMIIL